MALRKPLVIASGQVEQLQAGDTLDAVVGGSVQQTWTNADASTAPAGTPVYIASADSVDLAQANASGTCKVVGIVAADIPTTVAGPVAVSGVLALTTAQWDAAFGTTGGLVAGTDYYLSAGTPGEGTSTAPSTVGQYLVYLGTAVSTTELLVAPARPIAL